MSVHIVIGKATWHSPILLYLESSVLDLSQRQRSDQPCSSGQTIYEAMLLLYGFAQVVIHPHITTPKQPFHSGWLLQLFKGRWEAQHSILECYFYSHNASFQLITHYMKWSVPVVYYSSIFTQDIAMWVSGAEEPGCASHIIKFTWWSHSACKKFND